MSSPKSGVPVVTLPPYNPPPGQMGAGDTRSRLLDLAGIDEPEQVAALKEAWARKRELVNNATTTRYFSHEGVVTDQRYVADNKVRLDAAESLERVLGVIAPRAEQKVIVVHRLELPEWALPDSAKAQVIDVQGVDV